MKYTVSALLLLSLGLTTQAAPLELRKGQHICYIGNTLADRMQHFGWLETLIHARFPQHELVFRNLGYSGDELTLRLRSADFGSPDHWLSKCQADVIFAIFGYNESWAGRDGLDKFRKDLDDFVKHTLSQKYNGQSPPTLVLFSPIAFEDHHSPNLPHGEDVNERIKIYTGAMVEVAARYNVHFVDLFLPTQKLYAAANGQHLTINGIHLNERGDLSVAQAATAQLFPRTKLPLSMAEVEKLRHIVNDKNFYWFNRYRTVDGYSIFGGRADLKFVEGQTNRVVMQREMEVLDDMTANRDKVVWAAAQGKSIKPDDSNLPEFIPVRSNKPGPLPGGKHVFLTGDDSIAKMTVAKNLKVNLFASEEKWPELTNPVQMTWDSKGRLWVAVWPTYPHWKPGEPMNDKILIFEDTKGTGKADKMTVFADHLHCPTGFEFVPGGVLVAQAPNLVLLKDTKGVDHADVREIVLSGLDSADTHHTANSFVLDPGGAVYFQEGTFHHTQVETPYGPPVRNANAGVYRYEPRTQKFEVYVTYGFANPHGHVFDHWGQDIIYDGTGAQPYHATLFSGYMPFPQKHAAPPQVYQQRTRPCPGAEYVSSRHFPDDWQGNLLVANVIGFQGILRYKIEDNGSSFKGTELEPVLYSSDPNFRPSDLKIGPDGALYFIDWHNPIIGHMQHNLRDPNRDRDHGRICRVTYEGRELAKPAKIAGATDSELIDLLTTGTERECYRVRTELHNRDSWSASANEVRRLSAAKTLNLNSMKVPNPKYFHMLLEDLWLEQALNRFDRFCIVQLKVALGETDFHVRAGAVRILCQLRDRIPDSLELLKDAAADKHPRVRLEAVRAASFWQVPEAAEVPIIAAELPTDQFIDFVRGETMKVLEPMLKSALAANKPVKFTTEAGARYLLRNISVEQLAKMERTRPVMTELLYRPGVPEELRRGAVRGLASADGKPEARVLIDAIRALDTQGQERGQATVFDLVHLLAGRGGEELASVRADLEALATGAKQPLLRQVGYVAMITVDGSPDKAWALAEKSPDHRRDLLAAMPLIADQGLRASLYPKVVPLLTANEAGTEAETKSVRGRYVRIELPGKQRTLTLAEVEVYSDRQNVARQGKAKQSSTTHGGTADKAIDGNKSPTFNDGGQTHTREGTDNPWWELDLGREYAIDNIVIYNRDDGNLGTRLKGYTLKVLDADRKVAFEKADNPTPEPTASLTISRESPRQALRKAAMIALTSVRGQEQKTFETLAGFVKNGRDTSAAIAALQRLPHSFWPKEQAPALIDVVLGYIKKIPAKERTSPEALDALEFADGLASLLAPADAKKVRAELGELGVHVVRLHTLPERMAYDKELVVVKAGKPVEFLIENTDLMPHNFVIVQPGSLEEVGLLAEATGNQPDAATRNYVPKSPKILLQGRLLQAREFDKLSWTAPTQPGVYPFVCTYPGHWRRMYGALYVVEDLDAYQANPEAYLAKSAVQPKDELLKDRRPRTEWKLEDLAPVIAEMKSGRSYGNGKHLFEVASCISCHRLEGKGNEFGPDLTKLDAKLTPADILKDIIEPSFRINEKYQTYRFELKSGKQLQGIILKEEGGVVTVIENPLTKAEPVTFKRSEVDVQDKVAVSIMPKGLLDKLTRDEILDLIAFIASRGDKKSPLFQDAGHEHGGHQH
jgi:putative heme-binding domain-containing protein